MRADMMTWVQRSVAAVFLVGLVALVAAVVSLVRHAQGVPPLPVYVGVVAVAVLILLAGACLALISIAISTRRGAEALRRLAAQTGVPAATPAPAATRVFSGASLREVATESASAPQRTQRPAGRTLVAER